MNALGQRHRFLHVATSFVTLLFMGLIYAWSLFVTPIEADFGWERAQTSLIFTLSMVSFSLGMMAAVSIEQRFSPRAVMAATALIIGGGFIAASFTTTLMQVYVISGLIAGFDVGVGTDCVMSVAVKRYPEKHGLASGGMLMGFGMGAMLLSPAGEEQRRRPRRNGAPFRPNGTTPPLKWCAPGRSGRRSSGSFW